MRGRREGTLKMVPTTMTVGTNESSSLVIPKRDNVLMTVSERLLK